MFPGDISGEESPANPGIIRDASSIPGLGRSPGEGNGNPLKYACLENPRDRGTWWATIHGLAELTQIIHSHHLFQCSLQPQSLPCHGLHFSGTDNEKLEDHFTEANANLNSI